MERVFFVGKKLLATNIPARLAVSLVVLLPSEYTHVSKIESAYPTMFPEPATSQDMLQPSRGRGTLRVVSVRRNVRIYTPDLIKSATNWATRTAGVRGNSQNVLN